MRFAKVSARTVRPHTRESFDGPCLASVPGMKTKALIILPAIFAVPLLVGQTWEFPALTGEFDFSQPPSQAQTGEASRTMPVQPVAQPSYTPMTASQRFTHYLSSTFSPVALFRSAASAGIGQWRERPKEWREGSDAYAKRFTSAFAEHFTATTLMYGASSLLHEDNRYIRSGEGSGGSRLGYALESSFLARHDDGTRHFSFSKIGALVGAALISRTWQPESTRSMRSAGVNLGVMMGSSAGFDVMREFLPDLFHRK